MKRTKLPSGMILVEAETDAEVNELYREQGKRVTSWPSPSAALSKTVSQQIYQVEKKQTKTEGPE